jgi:hypothetical protein
VSLLLQNAVTSIRMGIEEYSSDKPDRSLSAVRNFYAGVLLLAKEVLVRAAPNADPDEIIGARYKPVPDGTGSVTHVPDGHRTIDFDTIGKRFKDFKLDIDQAALGELNKIRNEIEHRFTDPARGRAWLGIARLAAQGVRVDEPANVVAEAPGYSKETAKVRSTTGWSLSGHSTE